jgi:uncharacterized protein YegL
MTTSRETNNTDNLKRAQPFIFVVDKSGSMNGVPIQAVNQLPEQIAGYMAGDVSCCDIAHISMLSFNDSPHIELANTSLTQLIESGSYPSFTAGGMTNYGAALRELTDHIERTVKDLDGQGYRVNRPIVYFITDGEPTDSGWEKDFAALTAMKYAPMVIPLGFGNATAATLDSLVWPKKRTETYTPQYFIAQGGDISSIMTAIVRGLSKSVMKVSVGTKSNVWVNPAPTPADLGINPPIKAVDASSPFDSWQLN